MKTLSKISKVKKGTPPKIKAVKEAVAPVSVSWQENQPGYYKRNGLWYLVLTIVTLLFMLYAYKTRSNSFLILVIALYFLLLAKSTQSPQKINFSINQTDASIDGRDYTLTNFDKYYLIDGKEKQYIALRYKENSHEDLILPISPDKTILTVTLLNKMGLQEDLTAREPMMHFLSRVLKI